MPPLELIGGLLGNTTGIASRGEYRKATEATVAKGSSSSYAGWESLACARCGRTIVKSGPRAVGAMFNASPEVWTLCSPCIAPSSKAQPNPRSHVETTTERKA